MKKFSRTVRRIAGAAIVIAIALSLALLLAPWFIRMAPIENKIRSMVVAYTGDAVTFQRIDLSLLPRPRLIVRMVGISFRGIVTGKLESAHIYPELLPLLVGRIHIAKVRLERPDLVLEFSENSEDKREKKGPVSLEEQREKIASVISAIRTVAPELVAEVYEGRLAVNIDDKQVMFVSELEARLALPPKGFDISITGNFDHWGPASAGGRFLSKGENVFDITGLSLAGGRSSLTDLSGRVVWGKAPSLEITSGRSMIFLQDIPERLSGIETVRNALTPVKSLKGAINITSFTFAGPLLHPGRGTMEASGTVSKITVDAVSLPGPVTVNSGAFKAAMDSISVTDARAKFLDASFVTSILISGAGQPAYSFDVSITGNTGPVAVQWVSAKFNLPPELTLRAPLSLTQTRFRKQKDGKTLLHGTLQVQNGPLLSADIYWDKEELRIKQLEIRDEGSKASLTLRRRDRILDISFAGSIHEQALNRLFEKSSFHHGSIQGDLTAHIAMDDPQGSSAEGSLVGKDVLIPWAFKTPLDVKSIRLSASGRTVTIESSDLLLADMHFALAGTITASAQHYLVDGDLGASSVSIDALQSALGEDEKKDAPGTGPDEAQNNKPLHLQGTLRVKADSLSYGKIVLNPVQAVVVLVPNEIKVENLDTALCGITIRGALAFIGRDISVNIEPGAKGLQMEPTLACLFGKEHKINGIFDLSGSFSARGKPDDLVSSIEGSAAFAAREGRIYQQLALAKILSAVKISNLVQGKGSELGTKGLPYRSISIKAGLRNGEIDVKEVVVDSSAMNIVGQGSIGLKDSTIRMTVLVSPFTDIDKVVSKTPVINYILQGSLVSMPVAVSGRINEPDVQMLPAADVGEGVLGILKRTLNAPVKIVEPVLPGERDKGAGGK
jgi:hypothetical protein